MATSITVTDIKVDGLLDADGLTTTDPYVSNLFAPRSFVMHQQFRLLQVVQQFNLLLCSRIATRINLHACVHFRRLPLELLPDPTCER